jgi:hypothetical protein
MGSGSSDWDRPTIRASVSDRATFFAESDWTAGVVGLGYVGLRLVVTDHSGAPYRQFARSAERVFDTRGVYRRLGLTVDNVEYL